MRGFIIGVALCIALVQARAEKKVTVKFAHSPALAAVLAGKVVVPGQYTGDCAQEFANLVVQDMQAHGVHTSAVQEPGLEALRKVAFSVTVTRCQAFPQSPILGPGLPAVHISRTKGEFAASLSFVDAASGREIASTTVRGTAQKENESQTAAPEYPAPSDVKQMAIRQALGDAQHLYAPWIETREIPFMDSKDCHLKQAYSLAKAGDYEGLLRVSRANAQACSNGSKSAMEASYNLGVAYMLVRKYDDAAAAFEKTASQGGGKLVDALLDECQRESAALQALRPKPPAAPARPVETGILLTNDFIIKLIDGNIAEAEVLKMIATQPCRFSLEPADLARLKAERVPDSVVAAMRNKNCGTK